MPSQIETTKREEYILSTAGTGIAYAALVIGYLYTILSAAHLTALNFLLLTVLHIVYIALLTWMFRRAWEDLTDWQMILGLALLVAITQGVSMLAFLGLAWDWLIFLVTMALFFTLQPLRPAIVEGVFLFLLMSLNLAWVNTWNWAPTYASLLSLLSAAGFVAVFSLTVRVLQDQRDRAKRLLSQLEESKAELEQAHRQLQAYAEEVEELAVVRERTRMAREIHDSLGHYLSILTIQLETIAKLQERDPDRAASEIAEARRVAAQSMQEVRNAVAALRPTSIATLSLREALAQLGVEFERSAPDTALTLDLETDLPTLSPDISLALYRTAQEALTNIRKHAQASKVLVRLRCEQGMLELLVQDNGAEAQAGSDIQAGGGFGLVGLRERIELLGGQVWHGPAEQGGYRLLARVPVPPEPMKGERISYGISIGQ
jgi:signal transduction histidine kinase